MKCQRERRRRALVKMLSSITCEDDFMCAWNRRLISWEQDIKYPTKFYENVRTAGKVLASLFEQLSGSNRVTDRKRLIYNRAQIATFEWLHKFDTGKSKHLNLDPRLYQISAQRIWEHFEIYYGLKNKN